MSTARDEDQGWIARRAILSNDAGLVRTMAAKAVPEEAAGV